VILRTGQTAAEAAQQLRNLLGQLQAPRNQRDEAITADQYREPRIMMSAKINAYLAWVQTAEMELRHLFADTDLSDGLFGERYWHIAGLPVGSPYGTRIIDQETDLQAARFEEASKTLTTWQRLGQRPGELLALDTNTFLQFRSYNEIPWTGLVGSDSVRLVLAMPVLDEIEAKKHGQNRRLQKRARMVLPRIDKAFGEDGNDYFQVEKDGKPMTGVTLEILRDPPGYRRSFTDMDAEFLDRVEFLQQAAGRPVTVVTGDTGMKIRARARLDGLKRLTLPDTYRLVTDEERDGDP
jgi:PIN domain-containing protein